VPDYLAHPTVGDVVALVALAVLLVVAFRHLSGWVEAGIAVVASACCVIAGATTFADAGDAVRRLFPVVAFLSAILVVSGACAALGLFRAIGQRIGRPGTGGTRFLGFTFVAAVAVTAVLSLDATVVLLTPVVLAAATRARVRPGPALSACVRLANSSSLLLPVSNLTTLLALHQLDLSFAQFALAMGPAWLVVIAVEYAAHRVFYRRDLAVTADGGDVAEPVERMPRFPLVVLGAMLAAFVVGSFFDLAPAWPAAVAAVVLTVHAVRRRATTPAASLHSLHLGFAVFVLGLGIVVDAIARGGLGDAVATALPDNDGLPALLLLALLATVLSNVLNNLPATLLLVPLVGPLGTVAVLATLVGLNVGSSLTWTGSLANLLWRRTLVGAGERPSGREFHAIAFLTVPVAVVLGVVAVWGWAPIVL
jgi:arsenical pump membrane protein